MFDVSLSIRTTPSTSMALRYDVPVVLKEMEVIVVSEMLIHSAVFVAENE